FVGTVTPRAVPVHETVLRALSLVRRDYPSLAARLRLRFVGTSNQPDGSAYALSDIVRAEGLADMVREEPVRVPFLDALRIVATSGANLLVGSIEPHYTASKIYPGLMSGRPFLSVFHELSSAHAILARAGGGIALAFDGPGSLGALIPQIAQSFVRLAEDPASLGQVDAASYAPFTAAAISERYGRIFDRLKAERQE
ncbi:MAG: hypothetical protein KGO02_03705, partial [Alphaproteobacteria bacterium]|nr:hypothetical protein [Alphaproteobacteria bacterium]